jgi:hypothetical protein
MSMHAGRLKAQNGAFRPEQKRCQWQVLRVTPRPVGLGRVAVEVSAFCMVMPVFPFSGMQKLMRMEWSKTKVGSWLTLRNGLAIMATCKNPACKAVKNKGDLGQAGVLVNLDYSRFDVCDDDTWKYKIKCPECKESCGRSATDTVYLCNTVWKFEGTCPHLAILTRPWILDQGLDRSTYHGISFSTKVPGTQVLRATRRHTRRRQAQGGRGLL